MKSRLFFLMVCFLAPLGFVFAQTLSVNTAANAWTIQEWRNDDHGYTDHPKSLGNKKAQPFYFDIPTGAPSTSSAGTTGVSYFTTNYRTPIVASELVYTFEIRTTGSPVFNANLGADNQSSNCYYPSGFPAIVTPILIRHGLSSGLKYPDPGQYYRWYARDFRVQMLANTTVQVTVPMNPANWMSVYGVFGNENPSMFQATLDDPSDVGLVFGGGCYLSHGVNVQHGTGTAQFVLWNFQFQ